MSDQATAESTPVTRTRIGVATHVTPRASLTASEAVEDFITAIEACIADGDYKVIVDLSSAQTIDSLGIGSLMDAQDQLLQKGGWIKVSGHNKMIAEIAVMTGLADYVTFLDKDGARDLREETRIELGPGARLGDIGHAIQSYAEKKGCSVVREYCGHGIGRTFHEDPQADLP